MAVSLLRRLAGAAPVSVFVVSGRGARPAVAGLRIDERIEVVDSPRHATVLLIAGEVPADHAPALRRIHDQLPHPRAAFWWTTDDPDPPVRETLPSIELVRDDVGARLVETHRGLLSGSRESTPAFGPGENPTQWKGVGPHGQGGDGMMGGTPYGRSMAMTGEDVRDGLQLDRVPLTLGPYHGALPPGMTLDLELQGDVIVDCSVRSPGTQTLGGQVPGDAHDVDARTLWVADLLRVHGLPDRSRQLLRTAFDGGNVDGLLSRSRRLLVGALTGVGEIDGADALGRLDNIVAGDAGPAASHLGHLLGEHLPGMEWSEAVTTAWTLDPAPLEQPAEVAA